ncbi:MAG: fabD [Actinomycetia bacterium]|nr:fabD [Actinomycetes bacterium]
MEGEHLDMPERMVVSPAAGIFAMVKDLVSTVVTAGTTIGFVHAGDEAVPVQSPFDGHLVALDAVDGERLTRHQRIAWLRCA